MQPKSTFLFEIKTTSSQIGKRTDGITFGEAQAIARDFRDNGLEDSVIELDPDTGQETEIYVLVPPNQIVYVKFVKENLIEVVNTGLITL